MDFFLLCAYNSRFKRLRRTLVLKIELPFNLPSVKVTDVTTNTDSDIIITVETTETSTPCRLCGKQLTKRHGCDKPRTLRHTSVFATPTYIVYKPHRYICIECDNNPTTTATPCWHMSESQCTIDYENNVLLNLINSTIVDVSIKEQITEDLVYGIINRHINREVHWSRISMLGVLGIDEIALKKGHKDYITIITCRHKGKIELLATIKGREKSKIKDFLHSIPSCLKKTVEAICTDMYDGYVNAAREVFKKKTIIVIDRYHVTKLYRKDLDKYRQKILNELKQYLPKNEYEKLKGAMHILRKGNECSSKKEKAIVEEILSHSPELAEAYRLALKLTQIFNTHMDRREAIKKLNAWIKEVKRSGLRCFDGFIKTLKKYKDYIANYFIDRNTSGFVEGLNNKIKVLKRRCYGIVNVKHLFQRLYLDISGYHFLLGKL